MPDFFPTSDMYFSEESLRLEILDRALAARHFDHRPLVDIAEELRKFVEGEQDGN